MPIRLTETQRLVLRETADLKTFRSESGAALYDSFDSKGRNINRQVKALREKGLIQIGERVTGQLARFWRLTDQGRAVLEGSDTRPKAEQ